MWFSSFQLVVTQKKNRIAFDVSIVAVLFCALNMYRIDFYYEKRIRKRQFDHYMVYKLKMSWNENMDRYDIFKEEMITNHNNNNNITGISWTTKQHHRRHRHTQQHSKHIFVGIKAYKNHAHLFFKNFFLFLEAYRWFFYQYFFFWFLYISCAYICRIRTFCASYILQIVLAQCDIANIMDLFLHFVSLPV